MYIYIYICTSMHVYAHICTYMHIHLEIMIEIHVCLCLSLRNSTGSYLLWKASVLRNRAPTHSHFCLAWPHNVTFLLRLLHEMAPGGWAWGWVVGRGLWQRSCWLALHDFWCYAIDEWASKHRRHGRKKHSPIGRATRYGVLSDALLRRTGALLKPHFLLMSQNTMFFQSAYWWELSALVAAIFFGAEAWPESSRSTESISCATSRPSSKADVVFMAGLDRCDKTTSLNTHCCGA